MEFVGVQQINMVMVQITLVVIIIIIVQKREIHKNENFPYIIYWVVYSSHNHLKLIVYLYVKILRVNGHKVNLYEKLFIL